MDINSWIDANSSKLAAISDRIWQLAEVRFNEYESAKLLSYTLESEGFNVQRGIAGIPTAFVASYGTSKPVVAMIGEYDALPGLSQDTVPYKKPLVEGGNGHGCGHNLLGVGSLTAALAVKNAIQSGEIQGTIRYYGCPAEESGAGKAFMTKEGAFDGVDLSLCWHPGGFNAAIAINVLARYMVFFKFHGKAAHASADPFNGRSALDAVELMNVGVNYLREHIIPEARIHYVITNGGDVPNIVPAEAESWYSIRAPKIQQVQELYERVVNVARGAALMTDTQLEIDFYSGVSNLLINETIIEVLQAKMLQIGAPSYNEPEIRFANELTGTFHEGSGEAILRLFGAEGLNIDSSIQSTPLMDRILPLAKASVTLPGSTDVGDVSWVTPTGQIQTTCQAFGTPGHSWQVVAQSGMSIGHKGMIFAGKVLAATAIEFMCNPKLLRRAQTEFKEKIRNTPYMSPIPDGVRPSINRQSSPREFANG
jgi:aminobenzoyl-glutamate utilization protein B